MLALELALVSPSRKTYASSNGWSCDLGRAAGLVVDREHRQQVRAQGRVDQHLDADPASTRRAPCPCPPAPPAGGFGERERLRLGWRPVVVADQAQARIAERLAHGPARPDRRRPRRRLLEERVLAAGVGCEVAAACSSTSSGPARRALSRQRVLHADRGSGRNRPCAGGERSRRPRRSSSPPRTYSDSSKEWKWRTQPAAGLE